jgi:hypothetical protein
VALWTFLEVQIENNRLRSGAMVVRRFGVSSGRGESGASSLKGGGALQEIARALFVRSKSTASSAVLVRSTAARSTAAAESIIADRAHCTHCTQKPPHSQPRIVRLPRSPLLRYSGRQGSFL